jgi:hypothetical protein
MSITVKNETVFIITVGDYSEYSIHSVWDDEKEATKICNLLNAGASHAVYQVESHQFNNFHTEYEGLGYRASYDCAENGYTVDVSKIVIEEAIIRKSRWREVKFTWKEVVLAEAETVEAVQRLIFDVVAEEAAKKIGLTE